MTEALIAQLEALALPDLAHHAMSLALGYGVTGADREKREFTAASDALLERIRTATARAEALERENERLREALAFVETWVSSPVGAYSVHALDGLFAMTRERARQALEAK